MSSASAIFGLAFGALGGALAERNGLIPKDFSTYSIENIPKDWSQITNRMENVFKGITAKDVIALDRGSTSSASSASSGSSSGTTTDGVISNVVKSIGKLNFDLYASNAENSKVSAVQIAALLSGAMTGAVIAYYGTDKVLEKMKEQSKEFLKKMNAFDVWLKDALIDFVLPNIYNAFVFVSIKTQEVVAFVKTVKFDKPLKRIQSFDYVRAKDSVVVLVTPTFVVVKSFAVKGVERATIFTKASYAKAIEFADALVQKMHKKDDANNNKKNKAANKDQKNNNPGAMSPSKSKPK